MKITICTTCRAEVARELGYCGRCYGRQFDEVLIRRAAWGRSARRRGVVRDDDGEALSPGTHPGWSYFAPNMRARW